MLNTRIVFIEVEKRWKISKWSLREDVSLEMIESLSENLEDGDVSHRTQSINQSINQSLTAQTTDQSHTASAINSDFCRKTKIFLTPGVVKPPLKEFPLELGTGACC